MKRWAEMNRGIMSDELAHCRKRVNNCGSNHGGGEIFTFMLVILWN